MQFLLHTTPDYVLLLLRLVAGIIIFPYGMQKLFGWFDGPGIRITMQQMHDRRLPALIGWLVIIGQSFGSIALITGFLGRIAAAGNFIIFFGALITHLPDGWFLNWFGKKKGEGIEYFIMLLAVLSIIIVKGSGALSVDGWLLQYFS
jgi:putative oxidoreductase